MDIPADEVIKQHLIDPEICISCDTCESTCRSAAISHSATNYVVDAAKCHLCMACIQPCPTDAIDTWRMMPPRKAYSAEAQVGWDALPGRIASRRTDGGRQPSRRGTGARSGPIRNGCKRRRGRDAVQCHGAALVGSAPLPIRSCTTRPSYALGIAIPPRQKSVMSLGFCARNCGAAPAPLFNATDVDRSAIVMVTLTIPMMSICALIAARVFAAHSPQPREPERSGRQPVSAIENMELFAMKAGDLLARSHSRNAPPIAGLHISIELSCNHIFYYIRICILNITLFKIVSFT